MTDTVETRWEKHNEAGRRHFSRGDYAQAEQAFIAAIREATLLGADNVSLASSLSNLAQLKYRQKDLAEAEALFRRSLAIRERAFGADHPNLIQGINNLAALYSARGELDQAESLLRRALAICDRGLPERHPDVAATLNNLARLHFRRHDHSAAAPPLMRLLAIKQEALGASHPEVAAILTSLMRVRAAEGELDAAEQLGRRVVAIRERLGGPQDFALATSLEALAEVLGARAKREEEAELRRRAREIRGEDPGEGEAPAPVAELSSSEDQAPVSSGDARPDLTLAPAAGVRPEAVAPVAAEPAEPEPPPAPRAPTTRSSTLPWIEPPTSPALRAPLPADDLGETWAAVPVIPNPPARTDVTATREPQPPRSFGGHGEPAGGRVAPMRGWPAEPRRSRIKPLLITLVLVATAGGAWTVLGRSADAGEEMPTSAATRRDPSEITAPPVSTTEALGAGGGASGGHRPARDSTAARPVAPVDPAPRRAAQPPESPRSAPAAQSAAARAEAPSPPRGDADAELPELPNVDVGNVTRAIDASARSQLDSLGKEVKVTPPSFDRTKP